MTGASPREPNTWNQLTARRIMAEPHMYSPGAVLWADTILAVTCPTSYPSVRSVSDRHELHSYATDRDTGLTSVTCSCGWQSPPVETIPHGIDLWAAHVTNAYAPLEPADV